MKIEFNESAWSQSAGVSAALLVRCIDFKNLAPLQQRVFFSVLINK